MKKRNCCSSPPEGFQVLKRKNGFASTFNAGTMAYRDVKYLVVFDAPLPGYTAASAEGETKAGSGAVGAAAANANKGKSGEGGNGKSAEPHAKTFKCLAEIALCYGDYLAAKKAMHLEYKIERGDFDVIGRDEVSEILGKLVRGSAFGKGGRATARMSRVPGVDDASGTGMAHAMRRTDSQEHFGTMRELHLRQQTRRDLHDADEAARRGSVDD